MRRLTTWLEMAQHLWPKHFNDMTEIITTSTGISKAVEIITEVKVLHHTTMNKDKQTALLEHYITLKNKFDSKLRVFSLTKFDSELNSFITKVKK